MLDLAFYGLIIGVSVRMLYGAFPSKLKVVGVELKKEEILNQLQALETSAAKQLPYLGELFWRVMYARAGMPYPEKKAVCEIPPSPKEEKPTDDSPIVLTEKKTDNVGYIRSPKEEKLATVNFQAVGMPDSLSFFSTDEKQSLSSTDTSPFQARVPKPPFIYNDVSEIVLSSLAKEPMLGNLTVKADPPVEKKLTPLTLEGLKSLASEFNTLPERSTNVDGTWLELLEELIKQKIDTYEALKFILVATKDSFAKVERDRLFYSTTYSLVGISRVCVRLFFEIEKEKFKDLIAQYEQEYKKKEAS